MLASRKARRDGRTGIRAVLFDLLGKVVVGLVVIGTVLAWDALRPSTTAPSTRHQMTVPAPQETPIQQGVLIREKETRS